MVQLAFLLHSLVSLPASINFLNIAIHIPFETRLTHNSIHQTRPIVFSYALLLLSTAIISLVFAFTAILPGGSTRRMLALGMMVYHVGPILRALVRLKRGVGGKELGGPMVHLLTHLVVVLALAITAL